MQIPTFSKYLVLPCLLISSQTIEAATDTVNGSVSGVNGDSFLYTPGNGGNAADLYIVNNTSSLFNPANVSPGDTVNLYQSVQAGNGGYAVQGSGGNAGNATSIQDWTDLYAAKLNVSTEAIGGHGGNSGTLHGGGSGTGSASSSIVAVGDVNLAVTGTGGAGGSNDKSRVSNGQNGSVGTAYASGITTGNHNVNINVYANGGSGGVSYDTGVGGTAAQGVLKSAYGQSDTGNVTVGATQYAGRGGDGMNGAAGADGAESVLINKASGSTAGSLTLNQSATGGTGGATVTQGQFLLPITANGGKAVSSLNLSDGLASNLLANVYAYGGAGGMTDANTTSGGTGGNALADVSLKSTRLFNGYALVPPVQANATAVAGAGGASPNWPLKTGPSGTATANASAESAGLYAESIAIAKVQGAALNKASATAVAANDVGNPALKTSATAVTESAGTSLSQADAKYVHGSGFADSTPTRLDASAVALVSGEPIYYLQSSNLPSTASLDLAQFEVQGKYLTTQTGVSTVTETITIQADLNQLHFDGDIFLAAFGSAQGNVSLSQSHTVKIVANIETWTLTVVAQLLGVGSSFDLGFTAYDPTPNPSLQNFNQSFATAADLNSFYANHPLFDLGPAAPAAVPLPGSVWLFFSGLMAWLGFKGRKPA